MSIVEKVHAALTKSGKKLSLAESCTGGSVAAALTAIPGASNFLLGSVVAYSDDWKVKFLGVSAKTLKEKGAVSAETVEQMVMGLFAETNCDIAAAVSGIAGPTGGTAEKPVGTVYLAAATRGGKVHVQLISAPKTREEGIEFSVRSTLEAVYYVLTHR